MCARGADSAKSVARCLAASARPVVYDNSRREYSPRAHRRTLVNNPRSAAETQLPGPERWRAWSCSSPSATGWAPPFRRRHGGEAACHSHEDGAGAPTPRRNPTRLVCRTNLGVIRSTRLKGRTIPVAVVKRVLLRVRPYSIVAHRALCSPLVAFETEDSTERRRSPIPAIRCL